MTAQREYPVAPMVGVGAVVFDGDCVLLVRRAKAPLAGEWSLPGGAVELGETLEEAVVREVAEETGLRVTPLQVVKVFDHIDRDAEGRIRFHYVLVDFLCRIDAEGGKHGVETSVIHHEAMSPMRGGFRWKGCGCRRNFR